VYNTHVNVRQKHHGRRAGLGSAVDHRNRDGCPGGHETSILLAVSAEKRGGVIIGRFMPPHTGHEYLIRFAISYAEVVSIFLCSLPDDPIPGTLRFEWMREAFPTARIIHLDQVFPEAARDRPGAPAIWAEAVKPHLQEPPKYVFASERYGDEFADSLSARFVQVDLSRSVVPISAAQIRSDPYGNWRYLLPVCRPYYALRVSLAGSRVSAHELSERFATAVVTAPSPGLEPDEANRVIVAAQSALVRSANCVLFAETDPIALGAINSDSLRDTAQVAPEYLPHLVIVDRDVAIAGRARYLRCGCRIIEVGGIEEAESAVREALRAGPARITGC
jgi:HTH-type transcriptional repressor of NAD biosynthesis genes